MKGSLKGKYDLDKNGAGATIGVGVGELKLRASITDATVVNGPSMNGLVLAVEKPRSFTVDYNVAKKDFKFQFMNSVQIAGKRLDMTYTHSQADNRTILNGALVIDPANKLSANYSLGRGNCKLKYTYVHKGVTTFEPSYDLSKNAWDFAVARKVYGDDVLKATYQTTSNALGLEWSRNSKLNGCFKISASLNLDEELKVPKLTAESTWNFDM